MQEKRQAEEKLIVALGFLTWGLSMLMRTSFGYYVDELALSTTQVGIANAAVSAIVCISAIVIGSFAERKGGFFSILAGQLCVCAGAVLILALAQDFFVILISRVLLGIGCGPLFALIMKCVELSSTDGTYPQNAGFVSNGEACINTILGPVITVFLLNQIGFRYANGVFAVLLLLLGAGWIVLSKRGKAAGTQVQENKRVSVKRLLKNGSLLLCIAGGSLTLTACWCIYMYVPALLQKNGNLPDTQMSFVMTAMGVFMAVWMIVFPSWYSRKKAKGTVIAGCFLGTVGLAALAAAPGNWIAVGLFVLFGGLASVMSLFFMAIFSIECVDSCQSASALVLINGGCEFFGASMGPLAAGWLADRTSLRVSMLIPAVCMVLSGAIVMAVKSKKLG